MESIQRPERNMSHVIEYVRTVQAGIPNDPPCSIEWPRTFHDPTNGWTQEELKPPKVDSMVLLNQTSLSFE